MQALNAAGVALEVAGLVLGGFLVVTALAELTTGKTLYRKLSGSAGRRHGLLSGFCTGLGICLIDLTMVTGWNRNDPAITLATAGPAIVILLGLSVFFAVKSRQRAGSPGDHGGRPG